eukprot:8840443-Alexandrium_andersonii.AAC.1
MLSTPSPCHACLGRCRARPRPDGVDEADAEEVLVWHRTPATAMGAGCALRLRQGARDRAPCWSLSHNGSTESAKRPTGLELEVLIAAAHDDGEVPDADAGAGRHCEHGHEPVGQRAEEMQVAVDGEG